eukprot:41210_1
MSASLIRKILNGRRIPLTYHQKQPFHASLSTHSRYFSRYFITTQPVSQTENVISAVTGSIEPSSGRRTEEAHDTTTEESFWSKWSAYFKQTQRLQQSGLLFGCWCKCVSSPFR